jgi:predicted RNA-binding protein YlqC (UPF0109 family)
MLLQLLYPLIDHPEQCSVEVFRLEAAARFAVCLAPADMEKFTGRDARTAKSLQTIVGAVGAKSQQRFSLTFQDGAGTGESRSVLLPEVARR